MSDNNTTVHGEPPEDMCCLVTMEDITTEDGNYGACILYFKLLRLFNIEEIQY